MKLTFELQGNLEVAVGENTIIREVTFYLDDGEIVGLEACNERLRAVFKGILEALDRDGDTCFTLTVKQPAAEAPEPEVEGPPVN